jgi:hypothetical protein
MTPAWPDDPEDWVLPDWMFDDQGVLAHDLDEFVDEDTPIPS